MIKKNNFWLRVLSLIVIVGLYFFSRIQHLDSIPVFGDEAIYIRWSQIIKSEETLRFIPQTDGKQPLFMWFTAVVFHFVSDPLIAGRLISVFSGFLTLIAIFIITCITVDFSFPARDPIKFIKESVHDNFSYGLISTVIYLFLPFSFFFDRMAVPDNTLSMFGSWSLLFALLLAKFRRLDLSLILGMILGLAWLTKSPAIYFVVLSALTFFIFNYKKIKDYYLPIVSSVLGFAIYNILRLGPQFHMIALRNQDYIWSLSEIFKHPLDPLKPHLGDTLTIFSHYISWPVLIFASIGLFLFLFYRKNTQIIAIFSWFLLPLIANCAMAKVFTARYILFILPSAIVLMSIGLSVFFKTNLGRLLFVLILLIPNIIWIQKISLNPFNVKLTSTETGYLSGWTSGWGIKSASEFFISESKKSNVIVGTEGAFGTLPDGLQIYTEKVPHLTVVGYGLGFTQTPEALLNAKKYGDTVYLLINQSRLSLSSKSLDSLTLINKYPKPEGDYLLLYQLK
jgi:hypothetical protein